MNIEFSSIINNAVNTLYTIIPADSSNIYGSFKIISFNRESNTLNNNLKAHIKNNNIVFFDDLEHIKTILQLGNKSINQLKLWNLGFRIPDTVALDFSYFEEYKSKGDVTLESVYYDHIADKLGETLAIRCSSNLEDTNENSFAGTFDTYLDVPNDFLSFKERILKSFQKYSSSEVLPNSFLKYNINLGIMVQRMIAPKFSGFLFTMDPMNPPNDWLKVEYWLGYREKSEGYSITFNNENGKRIHSSWENSRIPLPMDIQNGLFISSKVLSKYYKFPQDAEFLVSEKDHLLYLVQSRPITAFSCSPDKVRIKELHNLSAILKQNQELYQNTPVLSSTNISELFVRAIPLGYSIFKYGFAGTKKKEGGISKGRSKLGYAKLNFKVQESFFYTIADQARTNILTDALTFRLPFIHKATYLKYFIPHYLEKINENHKVAIYPEDGLYLQSTASEKWNDIVGGRGEEFRDKYTQFLQNIINYHAPNVYNNSVNFFKKNNQYYRSLFLDTNKAANSDTEIKSEIKSILEYLRTKFCPQYVVFARLAFLCTHVSKKKIEHFLNPPPPFPIEYVLNELLRSVSISKELNSPNYPHYEYLLKTGVISLPEFMDKFRHLGSLDISQPRLGEYSIPELYNIFGENKQYDISDKNMLYKTNNSRLDPDIAALNLDKDKEFLRWYTFAGRFMQIREKAKFELLKILYALKIAIKELDQFHNFRDLIYYLEQEEVLKLTKDNQEYYRLIALQRRAHFDACAQYRVKEVLVDFSTPFEKKLHDRNQTIGNGYKFVRGQTINYGQAEGICLTARSSEEYLKKLAAYRAEGFENVIGIFKGVELSYFKPKCIGGLYNE